MSAVNTESIPPSHTNGVIEDGYDEDEKSKVRPADIDADMREMERRKRVELIMNSRLFREELERIIESQIKAGNSSAGLLQQISDMVGSKYSGVNNHLFRSASCAVPINDIRGVEAMGYAKGEKILRCKLAALFRLIDLYGWTQGIYNHVTARLSQQEEHFLVNPYGLLYSEVTASSLVKVDMQGNVIESGTTNFSVNVTGFQLHAAIYAARPDLKCIVHLHTPSVIAVSSLKDGLLPICQEAAVIGDISHHSYIGIPNEPEERDKIVRNLGPNNKVIFLTNHGALCCGETIEETFFYAYNTVNACETQLKVLPLGKDNLMLLSDETRKSMYDSARKIPENISPPVSNVPSAAAATEKRWRIGGLEFEALMRMLDNAGFRTGYVYRQPLIKGELPRPRNDVEVPPAVSSLGYLLEEEELYKAGQWKRAFGGKGSDRIRWLNSPNVYQKVEILETGTSDPKKITKWVDANNEEWVADGSPSHTSTPVKIENALQFVPKNTNPKEFKKLQQQIKDNRRADKITSGPQSHILEGVSWEEAKKLQDANMSGTSDQVILVGAASKGIIQREYQHNATVYKTPYAKNPFDAITDEEIENYKKDITRKQRGDSYYDEDESDALSSSLPPSGKRQNTGITSETEDESLTHEMRVIQIETTTVPKASQAEVVLSDDKANRKLSKSQIQAATKAFIKENYDNYTEELKKFYSEELRKFVVRIWEVKKSRPAFKTITMGEPTTQPDLCPTIRCDPEDSSIPKKPKMNELFKQIAQELITRFKQGLVFKQRPARPAFLAEAAAPPEFHDVTFQSSSFDCSDTEITTLIELPKHSRRYSRESLESVHDFSSDPTTEDEEDPMSPEYEANRSSLLSLSSYIGHEYENPEESNEISNTTKITLSDTSFDDVTVVCKDRPDDLELDVDEEDDFSDTSLSSALQGDEDDDESADIEWNTYESLNDVDEDYVAHETGAASKPDDESVTSFVEKASGAKFKPELAVIYEESNASDSKCSLRSILEDSVVFAQPECERSGTPDTYVIEDEPAVDQDVWVSIKKCISSANVLLEHLENRNDSETVPSVMANCCQMSINTTEADSDALTISGASLTSFLADSIEDLEPLKNDASSDTGDESEKALDSGILMEDVVTWSSEDDGADMKLCSEVVSAEITEGRVSSGSDDVEDAVWVTQIEKVFDFDADDFCLNGFFNEDDEIGAVERDTGQCNYSIKEEFDDLGVVIDTGPDGRDLDDYADPVVQSNRAVERDEQEQNYFQIDDQSFPEHCTFRNDTENISVDVCHVDNEHLTESASSIDSVHTSIFIKELDSGPESPCENYINAGVTLQVPETNTVTQTETVPNSVSIEPETASLPIEDDIASHCICGQPEDDSSCGICEYIEEAPAIVNSAISKSTQSVDDFDVNVKDIFDESFLLDDTNTKARSAPEQNIEESDPNLDLDNDSDSFHSIQFEEVTANCPIDRVTPDFGPLANSKGNSMIEGTSQIEKLTEYGQGEIDHEPVHSHIELSNQLIESGVELDRNIVAAEKNNTDLAIDDFNFPANRDGNAVGESELIESSGNDNGVTVVEIDVPESIETLDYAGTIENDAIQKPSSVVESGEIVPQSENFVESPENNDDIAVIENSPDYECSESVESSKNADHVEPSETDPIESLENDEVAVSFGNDDASESPEFADSNSDADDDGSVEDDVIDDPSESLELSGNADVAEPTEKVIDMPENCADLPENVENTSAPESFESADSDDDVSIEDDVIGDPLDSLEFTGNADSAEFTEKGIIDALSDCTESLENVENAVLIENDGASESFEAFDSTGDAEDDISIENDVIDEPAEPAESREINVEDLDLIEKGDDVISIGNDVISISSESIESDGNVEKSDILNELEENAESVENIDEAATREVIDSIESSENGDDIASVEKDDISESESNENSDGVDSDKNEVISISSESNKNDDNASAENDLFDQPEENIESFESIAEVACCEPAECVESSENNDDFSAEKYAVSEPSESTESNKNSENIAAAEENLESTENINEAIIHEPIESAELSKNSEGIGSAEEGVILESSESAESNRSRDDVAANENEVISISSESIEFNENGDSGIAENDLFYEPEENIESADKIPESSEIDDDAASIEEYATSEPPESIESNNDSENSAEVENDLSESSESIESTKKIDEPVVSEPAELAESPENSDDVVSMEEDNSDSSESIGSDKNSEDVTSVEEDFTSESSESVESNRIGENVVAAEDDVIVKPFESNENVDDVCVEPAEPEEDVEFTESIVEAVTEKPAKYVESLENRDNVSGEKDIFSISSESIELDENVNNVTVGIEVFDEFASFENIDEVANNEPIECVESIESNENVDNVAAQNQVFDEPEENIESAKTDDEAVTQEPSKSIELPRTDCDIIPNEDDVISISSGSIELDENVNNVTAAIDIFDEFESIENIDEAVSNEPFECVESNENVDVAAENVFIRPEEIIESDENNEPPECIESSGSDCKIIPTEEDIISVSSESIDSNEKIDNVSAENDIADESEKNVESAEDSNLFFSATDVVAGESVEPVESTDIIDDAQNIPKPDDELFENNAEIIDNPSESIENIGNAPVLQTDSIFEPPELVEPVGKDENVETAESNVVDKPSESGELAENHSNCLVPAFPTEPEAISGPFISPDHLEIDPAVVQNNDLVALTSHLTTTTIGTKTDNAIGSIFGYLSSTDYFVESVTASVTEEAAATDNSHEMNDNYVTISDADSSGQIERNYLTISDASIEKSSSSVGDDKSSHHKSDSTLDQSIRTSRSKNPEQRKTARQNVRTSVRLTNRRSIKRTSPLKKESSTDDEIRSGANGGCDEKKPKLEHNVTQYSVKLKLHIEWDNQASSSDSTSMKSSSFEDSLNCSESTSEGKRDQHRGFERVTRLLADFKNDYPKFISYEYFSPKVKLRTSKKSPRTKIPRKSVSLESSPTGRYHRYCHISRDFNVQSKSANVTPKRTSLSVVRNVPSQKTVRKPFKCRNSTATDSLKTSTPILAETEILTKGSIIECLTSNTLSPITNSLEEFELIESLLTSCEK